MWYCYSMNRRLQQFCGIVLAIYLGLTFFHPQAANFLLSLFFVLLIPGLIIRHFLMDKIYKTSINIVAKQFILNRSAIYNDHCTVMYTPDEKIVVMDNIPDKKHAKRMFTITKGKVNINKAWNRVCRIFDSFITLDSLASFYSYDTKIDIITLESKAPETKKEMKIDTSNSGPKLVEMGEIQADTYSKGLEVANTAGASFVNIENIQEVKPTKQRQEEAIEFHGMGDILSNTSNKIDVNNCTASELSILPGINIIKAKKLIEYRDTNGLFKSDDDFIQAAEVKEHFVAKIKSRIIIGEPPNEDDNNEHFEGRVVDF